MPLLTVSTADISILHSAKVVHFHHKSHKSSKELWTQPRCADQAQYHTTEVWLHRNATTPYKDSLISDNLLRFQVKAEYKPP